MDKLIILLGMAVFAGLHTLTARQSFKQQIRERVGDRRYYGFYRIIYNIFALVSLAPVTLSIGLSQKIMWQIDPFQLHIINVVNLIQMIGTVGMIVSLFQIDILRFAGIKQVWAYVTNGELPLKNEPLQHNGLYRYMRHPLYFFGLLSMWFVPTMYDLQLLFTILASAYFIFGSRWEERRMVNTFGQDYIDYQQSVPWLIPFVKFR